MERRVTVLMLAERDVERLLDPAELLDALADGFRALSRGDVVAPRRSEISAEPAGFLLAMPAWLPTQNMAVKLVTVFHGNGARGLPGHQALTCLFDPQTGSPLAVMGGACMTAIRTAAGAALSARMLARPDAHVLAIVGAGVQGRAHLALLPRARAFDEIRVASRHIEHAEALVASDVRARVASTFEDAVTGADVVCLCTSANTPVIQARWLAPGTHVTSVGYAPPGGELPRALVERGTLFVETRLAFEPAPVGCDDLAGASPERGVELGEVLLGRRPGRQSDDEITVYKSMGHAMEDMVAANLVYRRAQQEGVGQVVSL